jgi:hypothetical protein
MKITQVVAENFLGIRTAHVAVTKPVVLFAGPNAAGKSSLQEAVRMALAGETVRVSLKKEYGALVADGAKNGYAQVVMHDGRTESSATILLPSGKATSENYTAPPALSYVLDAQRFAHLEDKERRAFLFGLMGLKLDQPAVKERMLAKGLDAGKVERILPMLRAGFDAASKDAKTKATEAKGTWRAVTGETYGAVKAETWEAQAPDYDSSALRVAEEAVQRIDGQIAEANQKLGGLRADKQRADQQQLQLSSLRATAGGRQRVAEKLAMDEGELATWQSKVDQLQAAAKPVQTLKCPCCSAHLTFNGRELEKAPDVVDAEVVDAGALDAAIRSRDLMQRSVDNDKRDLTACDKAADDIKTITEAIGKAPTGTEIEVVEREVEQLQQARGVHAGDLDALRKAKVAADAAEESTKKAKAAHADVVTWDAIGDALAPDGIPGEMLAEALTPINTRLAQSALDAEWPLVVIGREMEITAAGRSYNLLSESEKWRADAMVAEAISFQSGLKLLVLDRFDVLDTKGRTDLLAWLDVLATNAEVDTALVFGTLKSLPADLPATVAGEWINNGQVGQERQAA